MHRPFFPLLAVAVLSFPARAAEPVKLQIDATDVGRRMLHSRVTVPAKPGPLTLLYPKWIPGTHGPTTPISDLAGFHVRAAGGDLPWTRDENDPYAIQVEVPSGADRVEVRFDLLLPGLSEAPRRQNTVASTKLAILNLCDLLVYPKSAAAMELQFELSLKLPEGWKHASALPESDERNFRPVSLETLIDSPILAGQHTKTVTIGPKHRVFLACESEAGLEVPPAIESAWKSLITESDALFGSEPFGSYTFLLALSDKIRPRGLEHHESSDNRLPEMAFTTAHVWQNASGLLPHEYVHAWCGKFRRPKDMIVPDFQTMPKTQMLWVYEGLTNYLGWVLTARSGASKPEAALDHLAMTAQSMKNSRGREWRSLEDTGAASYLLAEARGSWGTWRRSLDYYSEGTLLWLEVDTIIRRETKNEKSLDDFCKAFFACRPGRPAVSGYTLADVVRHLEAVAPYKWNEHFVRRVKLPTKEAPLDGLEIGGWNLGYSTKPSEAFRASERDSRVADLTASIGMKVNSEGTVLDAIPDGPAAKAGIGPGMKLFAVNGRRFTADQLQNAVSTSKDAIHLILENGDFVLTLSVKYSGGARFPKLERTMAEPDRISEILAPRRK